MKLEVLLEDNHCLAVNKPAGLLSQGDLTGDPSLVDLAMDYLKTTYKKPGNVYLGLLHRLDRPTSGIVLLAKTSKCASRLSAQFRAGAVAKVYRAVIEGRLPEREGAWVDALAKDTRSNRVIVVPEAGAGGKEARLRFRVLDQCGRFTLLELFPETGRSHQLRVQLADRGLPIVGDRKYGARSRLKALDGGFRIALHAERLTFKHPTRAEVLSVDAPVPADWPEPLQERLSPGCSSSRPGEG